MPRASQSNQDQTFDIDGEARNSITKRNGAARHLNLAALKTHT